MNYIEITYEVSPKEPWSDILIAMLAEEGFDSFEETENGFKAYITGDVFDENRLKNLKIENAIDSFNFSYTIKKINDTNWNEVWESNFEPVLIGDCYIRAPFHKPQPNSKYEIIIEPKMSFGTGHHETTVLMVKWLLEIDVKDKLVLDMGCGTGVLAVLASKKGAKKVTAIDNFVFAYENTLENAKRNFCNNIDVLLGDASELGSEEYDIILANITKNVLLNDMQYYCNVLNDSGFLLLSGFFNNDKDQIIDKAKVCGLEVMGEKHEKEWVSILLKKL